MAYDACLNQSELSISHLSLRAYLNLEEHTTQMTRVESRCVFFKTQIAAQTPVTYM